MRIVYFGSATFAVPALRSLASQTVLVVSQPAKPTGRKLLLTKTPVHQAAEELGLPVETPSRCRAPEFIDRLRELGADLFVVAAYGQILPQALLDVPRLGCFNLHGSVLPRWRGAAPIQRAIEAGDAESGVTLMAMDAGMDTGDIVAIARTPVGPDETAGELYDRLAGMAAQLAAEWVPKLASPSLPRVPQDGSLSTNAPKVTPADARLSAEMEADLAYRKFRAFTPSPGAWVQTPAGPLKVRSARLGGASGEPGTVVSLRPELEVAFTGGSLRLLTVQPAGKPPMSGSDYANGARLSTGSRLID